MYTKTSFIHPQGPNSIWGSPVLPIDQMCSVFWPNIPMEFSVDRPARPSISYMSGLLCLPVVLRCVVLGLAVCCVVVPVVLCCDLCIVLVFSLLCCIVLSCCYLLLFPLDIFLLSFTFVPPQDGTTRPTHNGFSSATSSTNATTLSTTSIVCFPHPNTLFFCLVFSMPAVS